MTRPKMIPATRITLTLSDDLYAKATKLAESTYRSVSQLVRDMLVREIAGINEGKLHIAEKIAVAKAVASAKLEAKLVADAAKLEAKLVADAAKLEAKRAADEQKAAAKRAADEQKAAAKLEAKRADDAARRADTERNYRIGAGLPLHGQRPIKGKYGVIGHALEDGEKIYYSDEN